MNTAVTFPIYPEFASLTMQNILALQTKLQKNNKKKIMFIVTQVFKKKNQQHTGDF